MSDRTQYRKLGRRPGFLARHRLWLGADHVLSVRRSAFHEEYRRFYFADIQAVAVAELEREHSYYAYAITGMGGLAMLLILSAHEAWAVLCGVIAIAMCVAAYLQPECTCYVTTRVSREPLPSLIRLNQARAVMETLRAEIEAVQGKYVEGLPVLDRPVSPPALTGYCNPRLHQLLFVAMIASIALLPLQFRRTSQAFEIWFGIVAVSIVALGVAVAIRQQGTQIARSVQRIVLTAAALWGVGFGAAYIVTVAAGASGIRMPYRVEPSRTWFLRIEEAGITANAVLGTAGLLLMARTRSVRRTPGAAV
jgi:hypothetical protein